MAVLLIAPMIVDVHTHFLGPAAIEAARRAPGDYGVHVDAEDGAVRLRLGEAATRTLYGEYNVPVKVGMFLSVLASIPERCPKTVKKRRCFQLQK